MPEMLQKRAQTAHQRIRLDCGGGYRRDHLRAFSQRVEVAIGEVRIMGSKFRLLQTLVADGCANTVPTQRLNWRCCQTNANPSLFKVFNYVYISYS